MYMILLSYKYDVREKDNKFWCDNLWNELKLLQIMTI